MEGYIICILLGIIIGYFIKDNLAKPDTNINQTNKFKKNTGEVSPNISLEEKIPEKKKFWRLSLNRKSKKNDKSSIN